MPEEDRVQIITEIIYWLAANAVGAIVIGVCIGLSPHFLPEDDAWALVRFAIIHTPAAIVCLSFLTGGLLYLKFVTGHNLIKAVVHDQNTAAAIVICGILFSFAYVLVSVFGSG